MKRQEIAVPMFKWPLLRDRDSELFINKIHSREHKYKKGKENNR